MAVTIEQKPKYRLVPAASNIVFTIKDDVTINPSSSKFKIKYTAKVYVHNRTSGLTNTENRIAVLKVTPNGVGAGIFDLAPILENYVSPDYEGGVVHNSTSTYFSQYNGTDYSETTPHTIHQIDDFSTNRNSVRFFKVKFNVEAADSATGSVTQQYSSDKVTDEFLIYNGVLYDTDILKLDSTGDFGYNLDNAGFILNSSTDSFLTNSPKTQYVRTTDYLTLSYFSEYDWDFRVGVSGLQYPSIKYITIDFQYNGGSVLNTTKTINASSGGQSGYMSDSNVKLQFAGVGTANLVGGGITLPANWDYYTITAKDSGNNVCSDDYYFYKQEEDCKGFETIRLTWLNKFGVWDYYNFTKKSVRSFNTKRKSYTQVTGTWNESRYTPHGYKRGRKNFRINSLERITLNTDFLNSDNESKWIEGLLNSPDVYIINGYSLDAFESSSTTTGIVNKYVEPVIVTTSNITRKTRANDKLLQYTIEVERNKDNNTQAI